jgi:hypothetical protein
MHKTTDLSDLCTKRTENMLLLSYTYIAVTSLSAFFRTISFMKWPAVELENPYKKVSVDLMTCD